MYKRDIRDYLADILDAIRNIEEILQGLRNFNSFIKNKEKTYSSVYLLAKIGEAVKKIPNSIKSKYFHIPWRDIAGMRDVLMHEYFRVDLKRVWETAKRDLKPLKEVVENILKDIDKK